MLKLLTFQQQHTNNACVNNLPMVHWQIDDCNYFIPIHQQTRPIILSSNLYAESQEF